MKLALKNMVLMVLLLLSVTACVTSNPKLLNKYPPVDIAMTLKQVSPHVYYVQGKTGLASEHEGFMSNAGVIVTDEGIVVFDALGSPSLSQKLINQIRKISSQPIKKVIISHYHADHFYGAQTFKELGARIYAPAGAMTYLNSEGADNRLKERRDSLKPWVNEQTHLVIPDELIDKDFSFQMGGLDFKVLHFGSA
ncbi:MAG: MBL fold metallo-hydrolase, partial [Gammaproteobacteria bacterium]|nr:MBL fold metallo-hydrolase [Gammaproteobacteria bacterium]